MKVLVLVEIYPDLKGDPSLMYVHTRDVYYKKHGIDVEVLNFSATEKYTIDDIPVITYDDYKNGNQKYDCLILHAANIRHHFLFLKRYGNRFERFIFFYHGHEVLRINKVYSKPYSFVHESLLRKTIQEVYDSFKLFIWYKYLPTIVSKSSFVFVSKWMLDEFEKWTGISRESLQGHYEITYNCVAHRFEAETYKLEEKKDYDFVTIRAHLDISKYSIDIVNKLAKGTPDGRFLVIGKGEFFDHNEKADNIDWWDKTLNHDEIVSVLDRCRYALMPTRTDAQGLMMCEMAAYGIPVITSNIPVCHEVFDGFANVSYISNEDTKSLDEYLKREPVLLKDTRYFEENTTGRELDLILGR